MSNAKATKVIRDAVHGDIEVRAEEVSVLDTPEVQRLRGIKQLGTAYLVYPSAVHTRFEHALGTLHLAGKVADLLGDALDDRERRVVRLAALVHDVTHIPFGHTLEDERRVFERHDAPGRTRLFLRRGGLGAALAATGLADDIEEALCGEPAKPLVGEVIRGTIGADLLDYLRRDALFCGLGRGYDERLFRYVRAAEDERGRLRLALEVTKGGLVRGDALSEILNVLRLRYTLCERVYFHHAKVAAGAAVSRAVEMALGQGLRLEDLYDLTDEGLLALLGERFGHDRALMRIVERVRARRLYKRAYVLGPVLGPGAQAALVARYHEVRAAREAAERSLAEAAGLAPEDVIVYCPEPRMAAKEGDVPVLAHEGRPPVPLSRLDVPEVGVLIRKHQRLWRFYVLVAGEAPPAAAAMVRRAAEDLFGHAWGAGAC